MLVHKFWPSPGGTQRLAFDLSTRLTERGHGVTVFTSGTGKERAEEWMNGILVKRFKVMDIRLQRPWYITPEMAVAAVEASQTRYDLVQAFHFITFQSLLAALMRKTTGLPFILTPSYHPWHGLYEESLGTLVLRSADAVIAQCRIERQYLSRYVRQEKIIDIPIGIDSDFDSSNRDGSDFRKMHSLSASDKVILYVGSFGGQKSVADLVKIMPTVLRRVPDAKLVLIGGGAEIHVPTEGGMSDAVRVVGRVSDEELKGAYASADVFAFPSRHESFGIAILEAAAAGLPIVSIPVGVAPEIVEEGKTGFICTDCNSSFADALSTVLIDPVFRKNVSLGRSQLLSKYSWKTIMDSIVSLYEKTTDQS
jgi:glycosyltransferase involved in cell wall biosynthesis